MTLLVPIVMFAWIPAVVMLFLVLPARSAVATSFIGAWLFLPMTEYPLQGLPDYTKMSATCVGILLATALFHGDLFMNLRLRWPDLPMLVWCVVPLASSISNGLGVYNGISASLDTTVTWGFPYLVGRLHFYDFAGLHHLARTLVIGGLVYVPFCLYEIKMSPQLNSMIYGFRADAFWNTARFGGWRPEVFMGSGLMVGMWMTTTALIAIWLWRTRAVTSLAGFGAGWWVLLLLATAVLCKSMGAVVLLLFGLLILWCTRRFGSSVFIIALSLIPVVYVSARSLTGWSGEELLSFSSIISEERADSLRTRLHNENVLVERAAERPLLGWCGYGRNRVVDPETGEDACITDGLWVIVLGIGGIAGLGALLCIFALPALLLVRMIPGGLLSHPQHAGAVAVAMALLLYGCDSLLNAMINPVYMLCAGGLVALYVKATRRQSAAAAGRAAPRGRAAWAS